MTALLASVLRPLAVSTRANPQDRTESRIEAVLVVAGRDMSSETRPPRRRRRWPPPCCMHPSPRQFISRGLAFFPGLPWYISISRSRSGARAGRPGPFLTASRPSARPSTGSPGPGGRPCRKFCRVLSVLGAGTAAVSRRPDAPSADAAARSSLRFGLPCRLYRRARCASAAPLRARLALPSSAAEQSARDVT